jgi:hypothetical protein
MYDSGARGRRDTQDKGLTHDTPASLTLRITTLYHYIECRVYAECHYAECRYAECYYAECRYDECHYAECLYAESHGACQEPVL